MKPFSRIIQTLILILFNYLFSFSQSPSLNDTQIWIENKINELGKTEYKTGWKSVIKNAFDEYDVTEIIREKEYSIFFREPGIMQISSTEIEKWKTNGVNTRESNRDQSYFITIKNIDYLDILDGNIVIKTNHSSEKSIKEFSNGKFLSDSIIGFEVILNKEKCKENNNSERLVKAFSHLIELNGGKNKISTF